jgi:hypothetical protein
MSSAGTGPIPTAADRLLKKNLPSLSIFPVLVRRDNRARIQKRFNPRAKLQYNKEKLR